MLQSFIAWIDLSEEQRRRVMVVVALFRHRGTLDELSLGMGPGTLADPFSPGKGQASSSRAS